MRPTGLSLSVPATRILSQTGSDKKQIWTNKEFLGLCHPRLSEGHQIWGACYAYCQGEIYRALHRKLQVWLVGLEAHSVGDGWASATIVLLVDMCHCWNLKFAARSMRASTALEDAALRKTSRAWFPRSALRKALPIS